MRDAFSLWPREVEEGDAAHRHRQRRQARAEKAQMPCFGLKGVLNRVPATEAAGTD